ncbi:MAG: ACR3 family arsenite efflux transporter [Xanthomonadales bacterium]|nr:ACR3 family arsenite efflux transporter [Xanthomonadales bacterium]
MKSESEAGLPERASVKPGIGTFERYLTLWVALCIAVGTLLGHWMPDNFQRIAALEMASVNFPIAGLVWVMIIPMLMKIDYGAMRKIGAHWKGIGVTLSINWLVKPLLMALLGGFFLRHIFVAYLPSDQIDSYIAGLVLLAAAPCTAMVFVWSNLCDGEPNFTLSQVAINDVIMVFAFAPIVALLLGVSSIAVPWDTLALSVGLYIVVPIMIAAALRHGLLRRGASSLKAALAVMQPVSLAALLLTLVLLFGFQGEQIVRKPLIIAMLAVPILIQVYFNSALAYWLNRKLGVEHCVAGPSSLIAASNFFELAVAAAVGLFGVQSGAALATVVGVLIEVPVMLSVVKIVNSSRSWYEQGLRAR